MDLYSSFQNTLGTPPHYTNHGCYHYCSHHHCNYHQHPHRHYNNPHNHGQYSHNHVYIIITITTVIVRCSVTHSDGENTDKDYGEEDDQEKEVNLVHEDDVKGGGGVS